MKGLHGGRAAHAPRSAYSQPLVRRNGVLVETSILGRSARCGRRRISAHRRIAHGGRMRIASFGSGALTNEKVYAFGKFSRLALGTRQTSITMGAFVCRRRRQRQTARSASIAGCRFLLEWFGKADMLLVAGGQSARYDAAAGALDCRAAARIGNVNRGGSAAHGIRGRSGNAASSSRAGYRLRSSPTRMLHVLVAERRIDAAYIEARNNGVRRTCGATPNSNIPNARNAARVCRPTISAPRRACSPMHGAR